MSSNLGIFSVLVFSIMTLFIPAASIANAQEYDSYYEDESYNKKDDRSDEPVIIIKNEPIQKKEKKEKKEPPMLLVKKEVLYCDEIANGTSLDCGGHDVGPDSDVYVQECTATNQPFRDVCEQVNEEFFDITITDNIEFLGSEGGTKLNFNGERYTVTEEQFPLVEEINSGCQESGFDNGSDFFIQVDGSFQEIFMCTVFDGECSGIVQNNKLKECTVKNYIVGLD